MLVKIFILLLLVVQLVNSFYIDEKFKKEPLLIKEFKLIYDGLNENDRSFPQHFNLSFKFENDLVFVEFSKLNKSEHPISSSDIYVIDEQSKQPRLYEITSDNKIQHDLYVQTDNKKGFASLIKSKTDTEFRVLATIFPEDDKYSQLAFEIIPVKNEEDKSSFKHSLHKRSIDLPSNFIFGKSLFKTDTIDFEDDLKDYFILPSK
jgi:hypothetical protein